MKKIKLMIVSALASMLVFCGFAFFPVFANAEESVETPSNSIESVVDEEVIEETESVENTPNDEVVEEDSKDTVIDFDDLLAFVGELAEKEGFKNEWDKAMYYVENAASEKKVEIMIGLSVAVIVLFVTDRCVKIIRWADNRKNDTTSKDLKDIKTANGQQTTAINGLIDEAEKVEKVSADSVRREKLLSNALEKQNTAIRCLIRGVAIKQDLKDEALRSLNESDDLCDEAKK